MRRLSLILALALVVSALAAPQLLAHPPTVSVSKSYYCVGDKTIWNFSASASGCVGPYTFSWQYANSTSATAQTNPNTAQTVWGAYMGPCQEYVYVTVQGADGGYTEKAIAIWHYCHPSCALVGP